MTITFSGKSVKWLYKNNVRAYISTMIENKRVSMQHVVFMQIKLTSKSQTLESPVLMVKHMNKITEISTLKMLG